MKLEIEEKDQDWEKEWDGVRHIGRVPRGMPVPKPGTVCTALCGAEFQCLGNRIIRGRYRRETCPLCRAIEEVGQ